MPQLSPMVGIFVFLMTNLSFFTLVLSIRPLFNIQPLSVGSQKSGKSFRSFS